jgi:hypothetical protein
MRKITFGLLLLALLVMVGCAKPPQEAITAVGQSIEAAQAAGAADYAPDSLKAAEDAKAALDAELKVQEEKFALFRSYKKADELALAAKQAGEKAAADAQARKEQVKAEATQLITNAKTALQEAKDMLAKAPKGKGTQQDLKAMEGDLAGVESSLTEAESALTAERFLDAKNKAETANTTISNVKSSIEQAIAAKGAARR